MIIGTPSTESDVLPRFQNRGPIEADSNAQQIVNLLSTFRGFRTAAPLKLSLSGGDDLQITPFRGFRTAAPLKQVRLFLEQSSSMAPSAVSEPRPH